MPKPGKFLKKIIGGAAGAAGKVVKGGARKAGQVAASPKVREAAKGAAGKVARGAVEAAKNAAPLVGAAADLAAGEVKRRARAKIRRYIILGALGAGAVAAIVATVISLAI